MPPIQVLASHLMRRSQTVPATSLALADRACKTWLKSPCKLLVSTDNEAFVAAFGSFTRVGLTKPVIQGPIG